ncbi:alginate O-acetyltransferase AlgF [Tabrizicola sp. BL-A-41-H6]|uniref:alginate O-acetyltransferase AlgF n=1 Tax=Tabrizicola sp. BL-A-41-H6 TaxID=3421107 RepID=UPI003D676B5D
MTRTLRFLAPRFVACAMAVATPAFAQDGALYEDPGDPNASFVRIIAPGETVAVVAETTFDSIEGGVSPYVTIPAGKVSAAVGDLTAEADIPPASFYTFLAASDGTLQAVKDEITNSPAQADLVFYNLSDLQSVDLFAPSVGAVALDDIAPNTSRQVTLRAPMTLDFEVRDGDTVLATLPGVQMRRRAGVTVVFSGSNGTYSAFSTENLYVN